MVLNIVINGKNKTVPSLLRITLIFMSLVIMELFENKSQEAISDNLKSSKIGFFLNSSNNDSYVLLSGLNFYAIMAVANLTAASTH